MAKKGTRKSSSREKDQHIDTTNTIFFKGLFDSAGFFEDTLDSDANLTLLAFCDGGLPSFLAIVFPPAVSQLSGD